MREIVRIDAAEVVPAPERIHRQLGLPPNTPPDARTRDAIGEALERLGAAARPVGLAAEIGGADFAAVYRGEGRNAPETPLAAIFPRATALTLFAVTIGTGVGVEIEADFAGREFLRATALDAAASEAVELAADALERRLVSRGSAGRGRLRYSPGYCGWHLSGQRALFAALRPEEIGIRLRESMLMEPLKSMSGVIVEGSPEIHVFADGYPFCGECRTRGCRERIARLREEGKRPTHGHPE
jgi:hypothetical protein